MVQRVVVSILMLGFGLPPAIADGPGRPLVYVPPAVAGMDATQLATIESLVEEALAAKKMPGCVVLISRKQKVVYHRAFGNRQLLPEPLPMRTDTVFDMASLTKPIATATSIMQLVERGRLRLGDDVADHLDGFGQNGKEDVTIRQMLTHQAGFVPDSPLREYADPENIWPHLLALELQYSPGSRFVYSDVGFQMLGRIVEVATKKSLDAYARENIFEPLGMWETGFTPPEPLRRRAATTEQREGRWMRGEVHDPRAYAMGGIAGHAGLFSTAKDLAHFAHMLLDQGRAPQGRVLSPAAIEWMTTPVDVQGHARGLGWDMRSSYSSNRGELMSPQAFGHGGFTGTAMWIDPKHELVVVFLSNRVHPTGKGAINPLAGRIGSVAVSSITTVPAIPVSSPRTAVLTGLDVLVRDNFSALQDQRVGLITNHTGVDARGRRAIDLLHQSDQVDLQAIFSPEHGIAGVRDDNRIGDAVDSATQLPVYSLYGERRVPDKRALQDLDALVFDIQDIGCRFYTYISTMNHCLRAADQHGLRFIVLDRPNPIGGVAVEGPLLDDGQQSFVGCHTIPVRHGMTVGELARLLAEEQDLAVRPEVILVEGWSRREYFESTGLRWVNPSPNMRSLTEAVLYPGIGLLETTNVSVGRGTDRPFEVVGAPYIDGRALAQHLQRLQLPGVVFVPRSFTPNASKFAGETCGGVDILITERDRLHAVRTGLAMAWALRALYPEQWDPTRFPRLLVDQSVMDMLLEGAPLEDAWRHASAEAAGFAERRRKHLLYD